MWCRAANCWVSAVVDRVACPRRCLEQSLSGVRAPVRFPPRRFFFSFYSFLSAGVPVLGPLSCCCRDRHRCVGDVGRVARPVSRESLGTICLFTALLLPVGLVLTRHHREAGRGARSPAASAPYGAGLRASYRKSVLVFLLTGRGSLAFAFRRPSGGTHQRRCCWMSRIQSRHEQRRLGLLLLRHRDALRDWVRKSKVRVKPDQCPGRTTRYPVRSDITLDVLSSAMGSHFDVNLWSYLVEAICPSSFASTVWSARLLEDVVLVYGESRCA